MIALMPSSLPSVISHLFTLRILLFGISIQNTDSYHRYPCNRASVKRQFQFNDCYAPDLDPELSINTASFVMAHDAATGYLNSNAQHSSKSTTNDNSDNYSSNNTAVTSTSSASNWNSIARTGLLSLYGKTQIGSVYTQLNDGARALDLRPKIYTNGTIGFHHGSLLDVPLSSITLGGLLEDAKKWCHDNPNELVLIFHSELVHEEGYDGLSSLVAIQVDADDVENDDTNHDENMQNRYDYYYSAIAKLKAVYQKYEVPYHSCSKLSGLTVGETMTLADLSTVSGGSSQKKGYLLAVDRHDMYGKCSVARKYFCNSIFLVRFYTVLTHEPRLHYSLFTHSILLWQSQLGQR